MAAKKTTKKKAAKKPAKASSTKSSTASKASATKSAGKTPAKKPGVKKPAAKKPAAKKASSKKTTAPGKAGKKVTGKTPSAKKPAAEKAAAGKKAGKSEDSSRSQAAADVADRVLSGEADKTIADLGADLISNKKSVAAQAARVLDEIVSRKADSVVPIIDKFATAIGAPAKRPAQSAANALPQMSRVAPARVARHLPRLKESFDKATPAGKDGLIRTFAGLCTASVAYQKRLEDVLNKGLREADAKTLIAWTQVVLPALKGEPHARARATVEARLGRIPKIHAQKIADFLGIKLRLRYR